MIIPTRKIYFANENANLIFSFNDDTHGTGTSTSSILYTIGTTKNSFQFSPEISKEARKQVLYYYLYRSLVHFSPSKSGTVGINGCVYDEKNSESINYHPVDAFMLNRLYADDFQEQFKTYIIGYSSYRFYLVQMYHNELDTLFFLLGLFITAVLLTTLMLKGVFKAHNWNWKEYNKQGIYLIVIYSIYSLIISASDLQFNSREFSYLFLLDLKALLAVSLIFFTEKFILKKPQFRWIKGCCNFSDYFNSDDIIIILVQYFWRCIVWIYNEFIYSQIIILKYHSVFACTKSLYLPERPV